MSLALCLMNGRADGRADGAAKAVAAEAAALRQSVSQSEEADAIRAVILPRVCVLQLEAALASASLRPRPASMCCN